MYLNALAKMPHGPEDIGMKSRRHLPRNSPQKLPSSIVQSPTPDIRGRSRGGQTGQRPGDLLLGTDQSDSWVPCKGLYAAGRIALRHVQHGEVAREALSRVVSKDEVPLTAAPTKSSRDKTLAGRLSVVAPEGDYIL